MWDLPVRVEIDGAYYNIRNKCDYRVVLDVIKALSDEELTQQQKIKCSLYIFYEDLKGLKNYKAAVEEMLKIINIGEKEDERQEEKPKMMDWEFDMPRLAPPISRVLGYSVRGDTYTHWYDFIGAYMEIGECLFANIISVRSKRMRGKRLDKQEQEFYENNKKIIDLPGMFTADELAWLDEE
mgnify:CR=1 FL=1